MRDLVFGLNFNPTNLSTVATWFLEKMQLLRSIHGSGYTGYSEDMKRG